MWIDKRAVVLAVAAALAGCSGGASGLPSQGVSAPLGITPPSGGSRTPLVNAVGVASDIWVVDGSQLKEYPVSDSGYVSPIATFNFPVADPQPTGRIAIRNVGGTISVYYADGNKSRILVDHVVPGNPYLQNVGGVTLIPTLTGATDMLMTDSLTPVVLVPGYPNSAVVAFNIDWSPTSTLSIGTPNSAVHIALDPLSQDPWVWQNNGGSASLYNVTSHSKIETVSEDSGPAAAIDVNENEQLWAATSYIVTGNNLLAANPVLSEELNGAGPLQPIIGLASDKDDVYVLGTNSTNYLQEIDVYADSVGWNGAPVRVIHDEGLVNPTQITVL